VSSIYLALVAQKSPTERLIQNLLNNPFAGIHQLNWFDWAMMIPYFTVLLILSVYGLHRYDVIRTYFKHRKNATGEPRKRWEQASSGHDPTPRLQRALRGGAPGGGVLQDRVPEGTAADSGIGRFHRRYRAYAEAIVERYQALGHPIVYIHRTNRHGYKAGALQAGLETATGDFVAVFDADFVPPTDFLMRTVHYFTDPKVGVVQTRWSYLNKDLQLPDGSGSHAARRAFHPRARRPLPCGILLQLQRHRRNPAQGNDRRRGRLATRHADRRFGPELSRPTEGLALHVPARPGLPERTAGGDARLPGAAVALGQGADAGGEEAAPGDSESADSVPREGGSVPTPDPRISRIR
jgi:hypothetical protein